MRNHRIKSSLTRLQHFIYPCYCYTCGLVDHQNRGICEQCLPTLPYCGVVCEICGLPLMTKHENLICGQCQITPPKYNRLIAPFWYQPPLSELIVQLKYHQRWHHADILIELFCTRKLNTAAIVLPMPSHSMRIRERGFNPVFELLSLLAGKLNLSCDYNFLKRIKNTSLQADKTHKERKHNIKNAFTANKLARYKKVILFDDVVTTGATVNEASKCLRKNGVEDIEVWTLARTKLAANNYK